MKILPLFNNTVGISIADIALSAFNARQFYSQQIARSKVALCRAAAREFLPRLRAFSPQGAGGLYPSDAVVFRAAGYRPQRVPDFCDARGALRWHGCSYGLDMAL